MSSNAPESRKAAALTDAAGADLALQKIVSAIQEWQQTVALEASRQRAIAAEEARWLAAIEADRQLLLTYLDRTFDERRENFRRLFEELDRAMGAEPAHVADLLGAITTLAMKGPFQDLKDVDTVTANLNDPKYGW
jgi:hypothetical protein